MIASGLPQDSFRAWYPAPGYRNCVTGALTVVGSYGYSWSSSVSGIYGYYLYFRQGYLDPGYVSCRGHGFLVRCLRE